MLAILLRSNESESCESLFLELEAGVIETYLFDFVFMFDISLSLSVNFPFVFYLKVTKPSVKF